MGINGDDVAARGTRRAIFRHDVPAVGAEVAWRVNLSDEAVRLVGAFPHLYAFCW